ncbi:MAG TPA: NAD-binding protein [Roseiflexaceae bacterium]
MANTQPAARTQRKQRYPLRRLIRANLYDLGLLLRESWVVLSGFGLLALVGTLYLHYFPPHQLAFIPALYETLKLLTFQSALNLPGDSLGQVLFFLLPLLGLGLIVQGVLNFGRLLLDKRDRRQAWQVALASTYHDHIIICGLGRVGLRVLMQLLDAGYDVVVIDHAWDSQFVERALNLKAPVVPGDAREPETLRQASIARARAVITTIDGDLLNIEIALTARAIRPDIRVILRVFNEELDRNLERGFGPNTAFSASALAAPTFAGAAVSRAIDYVLPVGDILLGVTKLDVQPDSQLSGFVRAVEEANGIRVLDHQDAAGRHPRRDLLRQLASGDRIMALGPLEALEALRLKNVRSSKFGFLSPLPPQHPTEQLNTVIICGLGKVGYRVVRQLHRLNPRPRIVVVRLTDMPNEFTQRIDGLSGIKTVLGDARDPNVLREAGIDAAYTVAALTADDGLNLQIGLAARRYRPDVHLVLRVFSDALADKLADMFGIRTAYSTSGLAGPTLAAAAVLGDVSHAFNAGQQIFSTDQVVVQAGDLLAGRDVEAIRSQYDVLVIGLRRGSEALALPPLDMALAQGDEVILLASLEALARMRSVTGRAGVAGDQPTSDKHVEIQLTIL